MIRYVLVFLLCLGCGGGDEVVPAVSEPAVITKDAIKVGVFTDTHYGGQLDGLWMAQDMVSAFNNEDVDVVFGLGDIFTSLPNDIDAAQVIINDFEAIWDFLDAEVFFVVGNHDCDALGDQYVDMSTRTPSSDYTVTIGDIVFVVIHNARLPGLYAKADTLLWLADTLENIRLDNKGAVILAHVPFDNDYPLGGWNANEQRAIVEEAVSRGLDVECWHGHEHNDRISVVNGVYYRSFDDCAVSCVIRETEGGE